MRDEFDDDGWDLDGLDDEERDALEAQIAEMEEVSRRGDLEAKYINFHLDAFQRQTGIEMTPEEAQQLGELALERIGPDGVPAIETVLRTFAATASVATDDASSDAGSDPFKGEFERGVGALENEWGRKLTHAEKGRLWEALPDEIADDEKLDVSAVAARLHPDGDPYRNIGRDDRARRQLAAEAADEAIQTADGESGEAADLGLRGYDDAQAERLGAMVAAINEGGDE